MDLVPHKTPTPFTLCCRFGAVHTGLPRRNCLQKTSPICSYSSSRICWSSFNLSFHSCSSQVVFRVVYPLPAASVVYLIAPHHRFSAQRRVRAEAPAVLPRRQTAQVFAQRKGEVFVRRVSRDASVLGSVWGFDALVLVVTGYGNGRLPRMAVGQLRPIVRQLQCGITGN